MTVDPIAGALVARIVAIRAWEGKLPGIPSLPRSVSRPFPNAPTTEAATSAIGARSRNEWSRRDGGWRRGEASSCSPVRTMRAHAGRPGRKRVCS